MSTTSLTMVVRTIWRAFCGIGLAIMIGTGAAAQAAATAPPPSREWTILIFMNGKNNLEPFAIEDFAEIAAVGSTSKVSFVVQMGRPLVRAEDQSSYADVFDGWSGARRFLVTKDQTPATGQQVEIVGGGEVDMGAPETLEAFLKWGKAKYPAKRYAVVIWNHGQGYRLMATTPSTKRVLMQAPPASDQRTKPAHRAVSQDSDTGSIIYNVDVRASLAHSFGGELKLVGFDACLMSMLETAYELKDVTPQIVASEELEPGQGWNYTSLAEAITKAPTSDESALASMIVASYRDNYRDSDHTTLSTLRSDKVAAVATELSSLSVMLLADRQALFPLIKNARAQRSAYNTPDNPVSIDLIGFLNALETELQAKVPASPALSQTRKARTAAQAAVVEAYASKRRAEPFGSYGIAIYFPVSKRAFYKDPWSDGYVLGNAYKPIAFVDQERWSEFLAAYLGL
jgi:Clostripain family